MDSVGSALQGSASRLYPAKRARGQRMQPFLQAVVLLSVLLVSLPLVLGAGPGSTHSSAVATERAPSTPIALPVAPTIVDNDGVIAAINALRKDPDAYVTVDPFLSDGATHWADALRDANEVKHDPELRVSMDPTWESVTEFVAVGPTLDAAFSHLVANPSQAAILKDPKNTTAAVGVSQPTKPGHVYLVVRVARLSDSSIG